MTTIIVLVLIAITYGVLLTQLELKLALKRDGVVEKFPVLPQVKLGPQLVFFFVLLSTIVFFYYFSGGVLGSLVLVVLVFLLFLLCS